MSRAMNLALDEPSVLNECLKFDVRVSAIEPLPMGGTHLVCVTAEEAEKIRERLRKHLITARVKRFPFYNPS